MAVGKAPAASLPGIVTAAAAYREALEATVAKFTEAFSSLPTTTIKRRLKGATIVMPNGFDPETEIECKTENTKAAAADTLSVKEFL